MTAQQISDLKQLQATAGIKDLQLVTFWANDATRSGSVTGTTAPNVVNVHDKWRQVKIDVLKAVATQASLVRADLAAPRTLDAKLQTWLAGLTAANRLIWLSRMGVFWQALFELTDGGIDLNPDATQDIGSLPVYGNSWSEQKGFGVNGVTRDLLEQALRS